MKKIVEHTSLTNYDHSNNFCQSSTMWHGIRLHPGHVPSSMFKIKSDCTIFLSIFVNSVSTWHFLYGKKITISDKSFGIPCDKWSLLKIAKTFPVPQGPTDGLELSNWDRVLWNLKMHICLLYFWPECINRMAL